MSRRTAKVAEAVREVVATTILFGLKDPRVKNVTVLWADAAPDLRSVKIYLSVRGDPKEASLTMHGLESARGFIQRQIADRLDLRYTPILQFVLDPGAKLAAETSAVLREAMAQTALTKTADEAQSENLDSSSASNSPSVSAAPESEDDLESSTDSEPVGSTSGDPIDLANSVDCELATAPVVDGAVDSSGRSDR